MSLCEARRRMVRRMELLRCRRRDGAPAQGTATSDEERLSRLRVQNCLCLDDAVLYTVSCESFSHAMLFRGCLRKAAVCAPGRRQQSPGTCATWKGAHLRRGLQERQPVSLHDPDAVPLERFASLTIIGDLDCGREADETSQSVGQRTGSKLRQTLTRTGNDCDGGQRCSAVSARAALTQIAGATVQPTYGSFSRTEQLVGFLLESGCGHCAR